MLYLYLIMITNYYRACVIRVRRTVQPLFFTALFTVILFEVFNRILQYDTFIIANIGIPNVTSFNSPSLLDYCSRLLVVVFVWSTPLLS